jgi:hypothetical protein
MNTERFCASSVACDADLLPAGRQGDICAKCTEAIARRQARSERPARRPARRVEDLSELEAIERIIQGCARACGVTAGEIRGPSRRQAVVQARQIAMSLARSMLDASYPELGRAFRRDHTTILHDVVRGETLLRQAAALTRLSGDLQARGGAQ